MKKLDVILICDTMGETPQNRNYLELFKKKEYKTERQCYESLKNLGHDIRVVGIYDDIRPLLDAVAEKKPDIFFNLVEHFHGQSFYERNIVGLFELLQIPYTGSNPAAMVLCKNKGITKEILSHHHIHVSKFKIFYRGCRVYHPKWLKYPVIIKPLRDESSYGISNASVISNDTDLKERANFIHDNLAQDVIAEEYIEGRELYVSMLGNRIITTFPIRELKLPIENEGPQIATYKVKWDPEYRKKWKVRYGFAYLKDPVLEKKIIETSKRVYKILRIRGYARIDIRLTSDKEVFVIEANPNPGITKDDDFALSARKHGLNFDDLVSKILSLGLEYNEDSSIQE
ncbi:ATP-grasp domain-containing protein [PVC group bacterium]|nr:ATP-grasp domain-containing protein [PVC group bacterium]